MIPSHLKRKPLPRYLRLYREGGHWWVYDPHPDVLRILKTNNIPLPMFPDTDPGWKPLEHLRETHKTVLIVLPGEFPLLEDQPLPGGSIPDIVA
jgi:hypothetical protein